MAADDIQRIIYKLEIDDSGYIRGVESLSNSTQKFSQIQDETNKRLQQAKIDFKAATDEVARQQRELDNANKGTNTGLIKQRQDALKKAQAEQAKLTELVKQTEVEYQKATKLATDFANTTARAGSLTQGGRIATPPVTPQPIPQLIPSGGTGLGEVVGASAAEFEQLRGAIAAAELALANMNEESEEFKALAPAVEAGKKALADYDAAAESAGQSTVSLRTQIRQGREELVKLEAQGKGNTKEYFALEQQVAKLTDAFGDQQQRIKILASDTKALDFGKGAITAATAAFSAYTSVAVLVGDQNEELQKKTLQLFAAMQLLQSLEQLSNLTRREGVLATLAQSGAQATYTAVVGASTGAMKAFRIALAATGVGALIVGIGFLVSKLSEYAAAAKEAGREAKLLSDIQKEANESAGSEIANLEILYKVATNTTLSLKERKKAVDELQKQYPDYFKNINDEIILQGKAATAYDATKLAILESAKARAIESKLGKLASDELDKEQEKEEIRRKQEKNRLDRAKQDRKGDAESRGLDQFNIISKTGELQNDLQDVNDDLADIAKDREFLLNQITKVPETKPPPGGKGGKGAIDNVFEEEKNRLLARLSDIRREELTGTAKINAEFAAKLLAEKNRIEKLLDDGKLTPTQAGVLKIVASRTNQLELDKALADFNKKVIEAREKLNDELIKLQSQTTEDTLNLIQDEFEKRKALINFNEQQELAEQKQFTEDRLAALELDKLLLGEEAYYKARDIIIATGEQNANNIVQKAAQQRVQLAIDSFKNILDNFDQAISDSALVGDKAALEETKALVATFQSGKISYEKYKEDLAAIQKKYEDAQLQKTIDILEEEIRVLRRKINNTLDLTEEQYDDLIKLVTQKEKELTDARLKQTTGGGGAPKPPPEVEKVEAYVQAIGELTNSVIQFWQAANEAESAALDRSISLQEKRVEAAQRIAERGNAQYLKAEEDRLKELQVARENAARRQLAIDAALQASQLLVGITGAISKIATPGIGIAETIGAIAVIVSSLAAGYGLVKSLQGNQPRFREGDPYVRRNGHPSGVDTIPAWVNEGEAIIPTETNRKYHPAIKAIYDEKIPAEHINNFVKNYHSIKLAPKVNYERIKESAELSTGNDGRMAVLLSEHSNLLKENNQLQREIIKKKIRVENRIDRDGVSSMVTDYMTQMEIDKHT